MAYDAQWAAGGSPAASTGQALSLGADAPLRRKQVNRDDVYQTLYGDEDSTWRDLPVSFLPRTREEEDAMLATMHVEAYLTHEWNHEDVDDLAFWESERMRTNANNIYANVRQVAAAMSAIEKDDFAMGPRRPYFSSWSRAEILFGQEYDEFNEAVKRNIDSMVRQPLEEELREQLEAIGEATLLPPTESEKRAPKFPSQGEVVQFMQENFLEGILPGVSLAAPNERYAEDIFGGGDGDTADELLSMLEGEGDGEEADGEGEA